MKSLRPLVIVTLFLSVMVLVSSLLFSDPVQQAAVRADEMAQNLGPVGPHEPILTTVGNKRIIAFYLAGDGGCNVTAVVWDSDDTDANTAAQFRVSLNPRQIAHIDSNENTSLNLQCGDRAGTLAVVGEDSVFGI